MEKILFEFTQDLPLTWGVFALHLGSRQNVFHLRKITFEIFLRMHYGFWKVLCHFQLFLLAMA